ncbi:MAG: tRNA pseudouridine(55) synthase TruB [Gemmatimonadota bacterium]
MTSLQEVGGVLPVDKPEGPTSHDIVGWARKALDTRRIGHTGTLDPFASGLLLLCVGPATRLAEYLTGLDKEYVATARLGVRTDTHDREGRTVRVRDGWSSLEADRVAEALADLTGPLEQVPPAFSAKKVGGESAHRLARRGEAPELPPVRVTVHELELLGLDPPELRFRVLCSSGTYVRALARDLGEALGVGAHLTALRRTRVGPFSVESAVPGDALTPGAARAAWISPADALAHLPRVEVDEEAVRRLATGRTIDSPPDVADEERPVAAVRRGELVAVTTRKGATLRPRKVFVRP